jgi:hypothetical protein
MNFDLFRIHLKNQLKSSNISARTLSLKLNKDASYIYQILNNKIKSVDYETAKTIFEILDIIHPYYIHSYLVLLGFDLPIQYKDKYIDNVDFNQCYKDAWGTQEKINDSIENEDIPSAVDFYTNDDFKRREDLRDFITDDTKEYNINYSFNKENEMKETIEQINKQLTYFMKERFDPNDYTKNHSAETVLTTLKGVFDNSTMLNFFLKLMSIPLHTIKGINDQNAILNFIENICQYEYVFYKYSDKDNEPINPNYLDVELKHPLKK